MSTLTTPARNLDELLKGSHAIRAQVVVWRNGLPTSTVLPVIAGTVGVDESQAVRRQCDLTLAGLDEWVAQAPSDYLDPQSLTEFCVQAGVVDDAGVLTWFTLGIFGVGDSDFTEDSSGLGIQFTGLDRADRVSKALFSSVRSFAVGTHVGAAIRSILADRAPWLPVDIPDGAYTLPATTVGADFGDPWAQCRSFAAAAALDLRIDADGVARTHPITDPLITAPSVTWTEGVDCPLLKVARKLSGSDLINGVVVPVSNSSFVGAGQFWDTDPTSPTNRSTFGDRPYKSTADTSLVTSQSQADALAQSEFIIRKGRSEQVATTVLLDPRRDAGDTATITRQRVGVDAVYRITTLKLDLATASMDVTLGVRRT